MPRTLITTAFLAILFMHLASFASAADLDNYLDDLTDKKVDIVFVFDTSNSMGGEINELRAVANKFAAELEAYHIDYKLGLVEFRDFPITCDEAKNIQCGSPEDFAYRIKGNGTLTPEISTFSSWLVDLEAGGGGSGGPEAVLAALRHAGSDLHWRDDAEKEIILLTDAGLHPDGSCCNAEGDTLNGTIYGITHLGARVNVIGQDDPSLKKIAKDTGGQFSEIRSGLSLSPLLEKITEAMSYSFNVTVEATCENKTLDSTVQLVGEQVIPYLAGKTEVWMYLDQLGSRSRYNLSYDQVAGRYQVNAADICGPVDMTIYGRIGEKSTVQTIQVDCGSCMDAGGVQGVSNQPPEIVSLAAEPTSPQDAGTVMTWAANGSDPDDDPVYYKFLLDDEPVTDWMEEKTWTWEANEAGSHRIEVRVRDAKHAGPNGLDDRMIESFTVTELKPLAPENQPPVINDLVAAQDNGKDIIWTANATDPNGDQILYRYFLNNKSMTDWTANNKWILNANDTDVGENRVEAQIRDGNFAGPDSHDDAKSVQFKLSSMKLMVQTWMRILDRGSAKSVTQTSDGGYVFVGEAETNGAWMGKTGSNGNYLWNRTFGGYSANEVQRTSDGGYIIAGDAVGYAWLIKTDSNGNKLWDRTFGGSGSVSSDSGQSVQQTEDGGYILAGYTSSFGPDTDFWLIKTDDMGRELWNKTFGGSDTDWAFSVLQTSDGSYILSGSTISKKIARGLDHTWLIKTYPSGNEEWERILPGHGGESLRQTSDGGYIVGGLYGLTKTDSLGNEEWHKFSEEWVYDVQQTSDDGYIIIRSGPAGSGTLSDFLTKIDSSGNEEWSKTIPDGSWESIQLTSDGGYVIAGGIQLLKTDANGNV